jgi:hypothetical protein
MFFSLVDHFSDGQRFCEDGTLAVEVSLIGVVSSMPRFKPTFTTGSRRRSLAPGMLCVRLW